jgi:cell wall assembly regulator SMI1
MTGRQAGSPVRGGPPATVDLSPDWKRSAMQLVAFVQERQTRHIIGAASARVAVEGEDRR